MSRSDSSHLAVLFTLCDISFSERNMNYSHVDVFRLFKASNKWSSEHLTGLHIEQNDHTRIVDIVDDLPLSKDDDPGTATFNSSLRCRKLTTLVFEALAKDFAQPTREQIPTAGRGFASKGCRNPFQRAFVDLRDATDAFNHGCSVQQALDGLASEFITSSHSRDM